ncbi:MAG: tandem-95 repeat protein, partial [Magnetococcales bacterium]|nr:tandem-95 repeat protein [Magnetococcales bacterium]
SDDTVTATLDVSDVNDAPTLSAYDWSLSSMTEDDQESSGYSVDTLLGSDVADVDSSALSGMAIIATDEGSSSAGVWQYSTDSGANWSDIGTVSSSAALLLEGSSLVRYLPDGENGDYASLTYLAWDQTEGSVGAYADTSSSGGTSAFSLDSQSIDLDITAVNDQPIAATGDTTLTAISEDDINGVGVSVSTLIDDTMVDVDSEDTSHGVALVATEDSGIGTWQYSTDDGTYWYDIASVSSSSAFVLAADDLIRFQPGEEIGGDISIEFHIWDGSSDYSGAYVDLSNLDSTSAYSTGTNSASMTVESVNDAPVISDELSGQYVDDNATIAPFSTMAVSDVDSSTTVTVTVALVNPDQGSLSTDSGFTDQSGGVYAFNGTPADAQTAVQSMSFTPVEDRVGVDLSETVQFSVVVDDGTASTTSTASTVVVVAVNDTPQVSGSGANQSVDDNASIAPFSGYVVSDPDTAVAQSLTVTIALDDPSEGTLTDSNGYFADLSGGVYEYTGTETAVTTAIQGLEFTPASDLVAVGTTVTTVFTISVDDGAGGVVTDTVNSVISTAVNDSPVISGVSADQTVDDTAAISPFSTVSITDDDTAAEQTLSVTVMLDDMDKGSLSNLVSGSDNGDGSYTLSGTASVVQAELQGLVFDPTENRVEVGLTEYTYFSISVDDGYGAVVDSASSVVTTSINDAPTITGTDAGQTMGEFDSSALFGSVVLDDVDVGAILDVAVVIDDSTVGTFTALNGLTDAGGGVYTLTGATVDEAQAAVTGLVFTPEDTIAFGQTHTTSFTISIDDGMVSATDTNTTVVVTGTNTAPELALSHDTLFFVANDGDTYQGDELWQYDGTSGQLVKDIAPEETQVINNYAYIPGGYGPNGPYPGFTTVTSTTTISVAVSSTPSELTQLGESIFFVADDNSVGNELWKSDGTLSGTVLVKDINSGASSSYVSNLTLFQDKLFFSAVDSYNNSELWVSDGSSAGTALVAEINPASHYGSSPSELTVVGDYLFFSATDVGGPPNLYKTNGTAGGTVEVTDTSGSAELYDANSLTEFNGDLIFAGTTADTGSELWKVDNSGNMSQVKNLLTGAYSANPTSFTQVGDALFFKADTKYTDGTELWVTDGTEAGTTLVNSFGSSVVEMAELNGNLILSVQDSGIEGRELWISDGTTAGTTILKDINATNYASSYPFDFTEMNGSLYFVADDANSDTGLWVTDGTSTGTTLVKAFDYESVNHLTVVDNTLYFSAGTSTNGIELWSSDGTTDGTILLEDITSGSGSANPYNLTTMTWKTGYFPVLEEDVAEADNTGRWIGDILNGNQSDVDDASESGIAITYTDNTNGMWQYSLDSGSSWNDMDGLSDSNALTLAYMSGTYVRFVPNADWSGDAGISFRAWDQTTGSDGTTTDASTVGGGSAFSETLIESSVTVYGSNDAPTLTIPGTYYTVDEDSDLTLTGLAIDDIDAGSEAVSVTLATYSGTLTINDAVTDGLVSTDISGNGNQTVTLTGTIDQINATLSDVSGVVYRGAENFNGSDSLSITVSDTGNSGVGGALAVTDSVAISVTSIQDAPELLATIPTAVFSPALSNGLYLLDEGSESGLHTVSSPGLVNSSVYMDTLNDQILFLGLDSTYGSELWSSDGNTAEMLVDINPGSGSSNAIYSAALGGSNSIEFNNSLFFSASDGVNGAELWKTDGTAEGTTLVADININSSLGSHPTHFVEFGGDLFFSAETTDLGRELHKLEGTDETVTLVKDIADYYSYSSSNPDNLTVFDNQLFFTAYSYGNGTELWVTDGNSAGTVMVADINSDSLGSSPHNLTVVGSTLFFNADDGDQISTDHGRELWKIEAGSTTPSLVKDLHAGTDYYGSAYDTSFGESIAFNGQLIFAAHDGSGWELWSSDGTDANTVKVTDFHEGTGLSSFVGQATQLTEVNGSLFFLADTDNVNGNELWKTDGTTEGTTLVKDIAGLSYYTGGSYYSGDLTGLFTSNDSLFAVVNTYNSYYGDHGFDVWSSDGSTFGTSKIATVMKTDNWINGSEDIFHEVTIAPIALNAIDEGASSVTNATILELTALSVVDGDASDSAGLAITAVDSANGTWEYTLNTGATTVTWTPIVSVSETAALTLASDWFTAVRFVPDAEFYGDATITYRAWDQTNSGATNGGSVDITALGTGGTSAFSAADYTNSITVNAVNDAPTASAGTASFTVSEDTDVAITGLSVADSDAGSSDVILTLSVDSGYLTVNDAVAGGVITGDISRNGDHVVTIVGTLDEINTTLADGAGVVYKALENYSGTDTFTVEISDDGATGGGALTDTASIGITISAVQEAPEILTTIPTVMFSPGLTDGLYTLTLADGVMSVPSETATTFSSPGMLVLGDEVLFTGNDGTSGNELWHSDGFSAEMVKDIHDGSSSSRSTLGEFQGIEINGTAFFVADDGTHNEELWMSDGTTTGTKLAADISSHRTYGSNADNFVELGGNLFFSASSSAYGSELFTFDTTDETFSLVVDSYAGSGSSSPNNLVVFDNQIFFSARSDAEGRELWSSDGTASGTALFSDISSYGSYSSSPDNFTVVGSTLFFIASDGYRTSRGEHGRELWTLDAGSSTPSMVTEINTNAIYGYSSSTSFDSFTEFNGQLFFTAHDGNQWSLWSSDGTAGNTVQITDFSNSSALSNTNLVVQNGVLFFLADSDGIDGNELWKTDGTVEGTVLVKDITASTDYHAYHTGYLSGLFALDDKVVAVVNADSYANYAWSNGFDFWTSDGTEVGTNLLDSVAKGDDFMSGDELYLAHALDLSPNTLIIDEDNTTDPGILISDLISKSVVDGDGDSLGIALTSVDSTNGDWQYTLDVDATTVTWTPLVSLSNDAALTLSATAPTAVRFIPDAEWSGTVDFTYLAWDQTNAGASNGATVDLDADDSGTLDLDSEVGGATAFSAMAYTNAAIVNAINDAPTLTASTTAFSVDEDTAVSITDLSVDDLEAGTGNVSLTFSANAGWFVIDESVTGGVAAGQVEGQSSGIVTITGSLDEINATLAATDGVLYQGDSNANGTDTITVTLNDNGLIGIDGEKTDTSTITVTVAAVQDAPELIDGFEAVMFMSSDYTPVLSMYTADGGLETFSPSWNAANSNQAMAILDNQLVFTANNGGTTGYEPWIFDGFTATFIKDIYSGSSNSGAISGNAASAYGVNAEEMNGYLFFAANDGTTGNELWKTDGTAAGTTLVEDINSTANASSSPTNFTAFDGDMFFVATDETYGRELYKVEGDDGTVSLVSDIYTGSSSSWADDLIEFDGYLYFRANDGSVANTELWRSDGTDAGTTLVADINTVANYGSYAHDFTVVGSTLFFVADDGRDAHGTELWKLDAGSSTPSLVAEINTGTNSYSGYAYSTSFGELTEFNSELVFAADSGNGWEVWKSDGTAGNTVKLTSFNTNSSYGNLGQASHFTEVDGSLFFLADSDGNDGNELWKTDGTVEGTQLVKDIAQDSHYNDVTYGYESASVQNLFAMGDKAVAVVRAHEYSYSYPNGSNSSNSTDFWISDGSAAGTTLDYSQATDYNSNLESRSFTSILFNAQGFDAIDEDDTSGTTALVSDLLSRVGSDVDGDGVGLAVTETDDAAGTWSFTTDINAATVTWTNMVSVSESNAVTLMPDTGTAIRFIPEADFSGDANITYRAWDQTNTGATNGQTGVDITAAGTGADTAFSTNTASQSVTVNGIQDVPVMSRFDTAMSMDGQVHLEAGRGFEDALALTGDMTIEAWFNQDSTGSGDQTLISFYGDATSNATDNGLYELSLVADGFFVYSHEFESGNFVEWATNAAPSQDAWHHVALVRAGQTVTLYLDGEIAGTTNFDTGPSGGENGQLYIGSLSGSLNRFDGLMDEVRIWDVARSGDEIRAEMNTIVTDGSFGLVGYWAMDDVTVVTNRVDGVDGAGDATAVDAGSSAYALVDVSSTLPGLSDTLTTPNVSAAPLNVMGGAATDFLVAELLEGYFTDPDPESLGVAIVDADNGGDGSWEYSMDGGTSWSAVGAVTEAAALVLTSDVNNLVRYTPDTAGSGYLDAYIQLRAWDGSDGAVDGSSVDIATAGTGGVTAFSTATLYRSINMAPSAQPGSYSIGEEGTLNGTIGSDDYDSSTLSYSVTGQPESGVVSLNVSTGDWVYEPDVNFFGADSFTVRVSDELGGGSDAVIDVTVTGTQDAPYFESFTRHVTLGGTSEYLNAGGGVGQPFVITEDLTIEAWVKPTLGTTSHPIVCFSGGAAADVDNTLYSLSIDSDGTFTLVQEYGAESFETLAFDNPPIASDTWYHVALSRDSVDQTVTLYLDGQLAGRLDYVNPLSGGQNGILTIGRDEAGSNYFDGDMDEVRVWDVSRTQADIQSDIFRTLSGAEEGLVGYWPLDESTGGVADNLVGTSGGDADWAGSVVSTVSDIAGPAIMMPDDVVTVSTSGVLVSDFVDLIGTDPDGDVLGVAITGLTETNGSWAYSTDSGTNWNTFGTLADATATLLDGDALLRYEGTVDYTSGSTANLTYRLWDQSDSNASGDINITVSTSGGTTAFSDTTQTSALNFVPSMTVQDGSPISLDEDTAITSGITSTDEEGDALTFGVEEAPINGTLTVDPGTGAWTYTPDPDFDGSETFTLNVHDQYSGHNTEQVTVNINPINDAPAIPTLGDHLTLDGVGDVVDAGRGTLDAFAIAGDLTLETWVRLDAVGTDEQFLMAFHEQGITTYLNNAYYALKVDVNGDLVYFHESGTDILLNEVTFDTNLTTDAWHHVSLVRDATTNEVTLYLDGVLVGSGTYSNGDPTDGGNSRLYIGGNSNLDQTLNGDLDEVRIWDTIRSEEEIRENMYQSLDVSDANLIGNFDMADLTGLSALNQASVASTGGVDAAGVILASMDQAISHTVIDNDVDDDISTLNFALDADVTHGTLVFSTTDGTYTYTPDTSFVGTDSFSYTVTDQGGLSDSGTIGITVHDSGAQGGLTQLGTEGNDAMLGSSGADALMGYGGDDLLKGSIGDDTLMGGDGDDYLDGGLGNDILNGGPGDDILVWDSLDLGTVDGGADDDTLMLDGDALSLDLTQIDNALYKGIENIDLTGSGDNSVTLDLADILDLSDESDQLIITGDAGDTVNIGGIWNTETDTVIDSITYGTYTLDSATLLIDDTVTQNFVDMT